MIYDHREHVPDELIARMENDNLSTEEKGAVARHIGGCGECLQKVTAKWAQIEQAAAENPCRVCGSKNPLVRNDNSWLSCPDCQSV